MLVASSRKRGGSSQPPPPTASVVYLFYNHRDGDPYDCSLYALNIAAAENGGHIEPLPVPLFQFNRNQFAIFPGFGALDSKIYIIGGMLLFGARKDRKEKYELDVYVFDTTKPLPPPPAVDDLKTLLIKGPRLNGPKVDPIVVTFDGRIYAFPRWFSRHSCYCHPPSSKCEVLNLELGSWVPLPDPPLLDDQDDRYGWDSDWDSKTNYEVLAYTIHNGNFVASTPKGLYCLNLRNPIEWTSVQLLGSVSQSPFTRGHQFPFVKEAIVIDEKCFAIFSNVVKTALCEYDFDLERGLVEEKNLVDVDELGHLYIKCHQDYSVVYLGGNKLCVIRCGLDTLFDHNYDGCFRNFISYDIFKVRERRKKKRQTIKAFSLRFPHIIFKVRECRKKKNNQLELVHCASSTFYMDDSPGTYGNLAACFPMMDKAG